MAEEAAAPAGGRSRWPLHRGRRGGPRAHRRRVDRGCRAGKQSTDDAQFEGHITQIATRVGGTDRQGRGRRQPVRRGRHRRSPQSIRATTRSPWIARSAELADAEATPLAAGTGRADRRGLDAQRRPQCQRRRRGGPGRHRASPTARSRRRRRSSSPRRRGCASARRRRRRSAKDVERLKPLVAKEEIAQQQFDAAVAAADAAARRRRRRAVGRRRGQTAVAVAEQRAVQARVPRVPGARPALQSANTAPEQMQVTKRARARRRGHASSRRRPRSRRRSSISSARRSRRRRPASSAASRSKLGQVMQAGQPLLALVSLDDVWVVANFKETQLADMRVGQRATIEVDALGGTEFNGQGRQHRRRDRREVQPAAAGERHRQLRQGGAARAGEDRARCRPGSGSSPPARACRCCRRSTRNRTPWHGTPARQSVDRRDRGHVRDLHGGAGHDRRQRVAAAHRRQPVGDDRRIHLGADVVPGGQRHHPAADRMARDPLRPQAAADGVGHRLHDRRRCSAASRRTCRCWSCSG